MPSGDVEMEGIPDIERGDNGDYPGFADIYDDDDVDDLQQGEDDGD